MKHNDKEEKKINLWRRFIRFLLSFFRLRRNPNMIKEETSVDLEKAALLHNATALSVTSATVAASVQSSPGGALPASSSPTLPRLHVSIEPSTNSDTGDTSLENGEKNTNVSLSVSEGEGDAEDSHAFNCSESSDIDLIRYLFLCLSELSDDVAEVILYKINQASDPTLPEKSTQAANEGDPSNLQLLERLRNIPPAVYEQVNKEEQLKEEACLDNGADRESTTDNSPRNR